MRFSAFIKTAILSLTILFVLLFVKTPAFAQTENQITQPQQAQPYLANSNTSPDVPKNLHTWTQTVLIEVISASSCAITGIDPINPTQECLGVNQKTSQIGYVQNTGGAMGMLASSMNFLYTPPLHTGDYFSYLSNNFGLTKATYAANTTGTGFDQLSPLMNIWVAFRNVAYILFIIIFLLIGIAIMLRVRIDPRVVMTIQNQIPKLIIGVIMVTFSFAIAGFLIDIMWTSMYASFDLLSTVPGSVLTGLDPQSMQMQTPLGLANSKYYITNGFGTGIAAISNQASTSLKGVVQSSLGFATCGNPPSPLTCFNNLFNPLNVFFDVASTNVISTVFDIIAWIAGVGMYFKVAGLVAASTSGILFGLGNLFGIAGGQGAGLVAGGATYALMQFVLREVLPWLIIFLVVYIAMFVALIKLWFELLKAYIFILFDVILAPFWIMASLIPGNTGISISSWLKDLAANLAVFPAVALMFMLGKILMDAFSGPSGSGAKFVPPLVGTPGDPNLLAALIGFGIIISTPQVVVMVKKAFKAPTLNLNTFGALKAGVGIPTKTATGTAGLVTAGMFDYTGAKRPSFSLGGVLQRLVR
jgi:hypothetical protein